MLKLALVSLCAVVAAGAQAFVITATPIPAKLIKINFGPLPKGMSGLDLSVCNVSTTTQSLTSARVYQALVLADPNIEPVGGNILLAAILKNQNNSVKTWLGVGLNTVTGTLSVLGTSSAVHIGSAWTNGLALGALLGSVILSNLSPELTANQVQTFQAQVMPPAMILDSGTCIERTVFTVVPKKAVPLARNLKMEIQ